MATKEQALGNGPIEALPVLNRIRQIPELAPISMTFHENVDPKSVEGIRVGRAIHVTGSTEQEFDGMRPRIDICVVESENKEEPIQYSLRLLSEIGGSKGDLHYVVGGRIGVGEIDIQKYPNYAKFVFQTAMALTSQLGSEN